MERNSVGIGSPCLTRQAPCGPGEGDKDSANSRLLEQNPEAARQAAISHA
jgi:hypothetical protein